MNGVRPLLPDPVELSRLRSQNGGLDTKTIQGFQQHIYAQYHANPRPMPWRDTHDPYRILLSEVMLQQTRVERVKYKYSEFLGAFPTLSDLAAAPLVDVLRVWQGLGYNRPSIALKRCPEELLTRFNGQFPSAISDLESLPGIGPYTARAVAVFAFGISAAFIETNIRTVFIHLFFHDHDKVSDREIMPLVTATLVHNNPREWYYALMDFGVTLKQLHPNPGRRSRHHSQQTRFEGSNRQQRSRLLRAVIASPGISTLKLAVLLDAEQPDVERNLGDMVREGFLYQEDSGYTVRGGTKKG